VRVTENGPRNDSFEIIFFLRPKDFKLLSQTAGNLINNCISFKVRRLW
jgi:hypothetical protein